ncbi:MAG: precorrin-2 dehydrogenase/sirohydrochlorin ferrochelatase family protein [Planctomycetota bacterium]
MNVYPIMLKLTARRVVVVGAGPVALRKVETLKKAGANVTVVSKDIPADADLNGVEVIGEEYRSELLSGAALVFACTNDREVNARIAADARQAGALVNCVDQPEDCDFFAPAVIADEQVVVAISSGGASPALAGHLKNRLAEALPKRIGSFAAALGQMREELKVRISDVAHRGEILKALAGDEGYAAFLKGGEEELAKMLEKLLAQDQQ